MKITRLLLLLMLSMVLGCSDDDSASIENGINKAPNLQPLGSSANDFLSAENYESIVLEVLYVADFRPAPQTLTNLRNFIEARLNKPGGITITEREIPSPGNSPYTNSEIAAIENTHRTKYNDVNSLAVFLLFVDGNFDTDTNNEFTLGTAYRNTSFVIYENSVRFLSNASATNRSDLETVVVLHEFCHLLGLVDLGSPMQTNHRDDDHGKHCNNSSCLMFWQSENSMISSGNIPQLDANCITDLQANGGK